MEGLLEDANLTPLDDIEGVAILSLMNSMMKGHVSHMQVLSLGVPSFALVGPSVTLPVSHTVLSKTMSLSLPIAATSAIFTAPPPQR